MARLGVLELQNLVFIPRSYVLKEIDEFQLKVIISDSTMWLLKLTTAFRYSVKVKLVKLQTYLVCNKLRFSCPA